MAKPSYNLLCIKSMGIIGILGEEFQRHRIPQTLNTLNSWLRAALLWLGGHPTRVSPALRGTAIGSER